MNRHPPCLAAACLMGTFFSPIARAQQTTADNNAIRVTVSLNDDGSRTIYKFDGANHKATATTKDAAGKVRGTIRYILDEAGRFQHGDVMGPDGRLRFKADYRYNDAGQMQEERQSRKDGRLLRRIVYHYDATGRQTGYAAYNGAGQLIGQVKAPGPSATAAQAKRH